MEHRAVDSMAVYEAIIGVTGYSYVEFVVLPVPSHEVLKGRNNLLHGSIRWVEAGLTKPTGVILSGTCKKIHLLLY